jgi:hypothetical protein
VSDEDIGKSRPGCLLWRAHRLNGSLVLDCPLSQLLVYRRWRQGYRREV